ncbi:hypothetical protein AURDEDRAFT_163413 [Auricularia subglabra TFB-10046 SS5]|nr:hypothetical protein AURDEDRAFT_163413 [Auricularia subglabra TFB-10046 SS5]
MRQEMLVMASIIQGLTLREPAHPTRVHSNPPVPASAMSYPAMLVAHQGRLVSASSGLSSDSRAVPTLPGHVAVPAPVDPGVDGTARLGHWPNARLESPPIAMPFPAHPDSTVLAHPEHTARLDSAGFRTSALPLSDAGLQSFVAGPSPSSSPALFAPSASPALQSSPPLHAPAQAPPTLLHLVPHSAASHSAMLVDSQCTPPVPVLPMPAYVSTNADHTALIQSWHQICADYATQLPQIAAGDWCPSKDGRSWVPVYKFSGNTGLLDLWKEWTEGYNGKLSVEALNTGWASAWRTEQAVRTAYCRRSRVIGLLQEIMGLQRAWGIHLAIRFLHGKSKDYQKHTSLYNALNTSGTEAKLLADARTHRFSQPS